MDLLSSLLASSCESYEYPQRGGDSAGRSAESMSDAVSAFLVSGGEPGVLRPAQVVKGHTSESEKYRVMASPS